MAEKKRISKTTVSKSLARQIAAYSAAAGAVLAMGPQAEAAIHAYFPQEPSTGSHIDMDMDGVDDFSISQHVTTTEPTWSAYCEAYIFHRLDIKGNGSQNQIDGNDYAAALRLKNGATFNPNRGEATLMKSRTGRLCTRSDRW